MCGRFFLESFRKSGLDFGTEVGCEEGTCESLRIAQGKSS